MNTEQQLLLQKYASAVSDAPTYLHLTSDHDRSAFMQRHVMDAVGIHNLLPPSLFGQAQKVADTGTGNGVPGVVLSILEPLWDICMIDSDNKKALFVDTFCKNNAINNAHVLPERAEDIGRGPLRSTFDLVFARALGKLPMVLELTAPLVKPGGLVIVPHGTSWEYEWRRSMNGANLLGMELEDKKTYVIGVISFVLAIFRKVGPCPDKYPRRFAQISKKPL